MKTPRIGLVVPFLANGGGIESTARFLCESIERSGRYSIELISPATSHRDRSGVRILSPASWLRGVRRDSVAWRGRPVSHVGAFLSELEFQRYRPRPALTQLLDRCDLVQIIAGSPAWGLLAREATKPVAVQVAALAVEERRKKLAANWKPRTWWHWMMTRVTARLDLAALRQVDTVFVLNSPMVAFVREHAPGAEVVMAPQGVDTQLFRPSGQSPPEGAILSVGRFDDPRKNVSLLFEAYARLLRRLPQAPHLVLAGNTPPSLAAWRVAEAAGVRERVIFRERLPRSDLARLYRSSSMFVLSSDQEGLGIVILEAMASGLPVVSTDCGGPATSVVDGETGYLVPRGDAESMAARMYELIADPAVRRRMSSKARERAEAEFSLEVAAKRYLDHYDRMLARSR